MQINISTRHGHISPETQKKITERLQKLDRYKERITATVVTIDLEVEDKPDIEVRLSIERSEDMVAHDQGENMWAVIDSVIRKLETQLRRYKEKHKDHRTQSIKHQPGPEEV